MGDRAVRCLLCVLLATGAGGLVGCGGDEGDADAGAEAGSAPADVRLYLGGLGEIFVVDVEDERAERLHFPALVGGDPSNLIEARGGGFALWSGSRTLFSDFDLARPPSLIGKSRFFVASAEPDRVWLIGNPQGEPGQHGFVREVDTGGTLTTPPLPPPPGYPVAAFSSGLGFQELRQLTLWNAREDQDFDRIPTGGGLVGVSREDAITLCDFEEGRELLIAAVSSGEAIPIDTPPNVVGVDCRAGEISPDGDLLAAPVVTSNRPLSKAPVALGIADLQTHRLTVVPRTRVPSSYRYARWSPDGSSAFILGRASDGPRKGNVESRIVEYTTASRSTREIDVDLGGFYDVVATEAEGPLPSRSYADPGPGDQR